MMGFLKLIIYFLIFYIIYTLIRYIKMLKISINNSKQKFTHSNPSHQEQNKFKDIEDANYVEIHDEAKKQSGK